MRTSNIFIRAARSIMNKFGMQGLAQVMGVDEAVKLQLNPYVYGSRGKQDLKGLDRTRYGESKAQSKQRLKNRKKRKQRRK